MISKDATKKQNASNAVSEFESECCKLGLTFTDEQLKKYAIFYDFVIKTNKLFNLTAITDEREFYVRHYLDSLVPQSEITLNARALDLGCGAGFPSVPLKIARPDLDITALDATAKKIDFVNAAAKRLELRGFCAICRRAEDKAGGELRESFDCVLSRAVAPLPALLELALAYVKVGGRFFAYKSSEDELSLSQNALSQLGAEHRKTINAALPDGSARSVLIFEKMQKTPQKYPRQYAKIKKNPL